MPKQIIPVTGLSETGLIADMPPVTLPPNAFSDCNNVRFRNGAASKVRGAIDIMPFVMLGTYDILKYVAWWPSPNLAIFNQGYYLLVVRRDSNEHVYVLKVGEMGTAEEPVVLEEIQPLHTTSHVGGNWQHTLFQGGFAFVINNGLEAPHYLLDPADNTEVSGLGSGVPGSIVNRFGELPGWDSYAVGTENVGNVTAAVIRSFGDFLVAGNLVERTADGGDIVRSLPGVIRTSDIATAGSIPQNWNPFAVGVNTADEFTLTADGVVQDLVELQGKMFAYSNSSISSISRTGNPNGPFSVATVTPAYGALTTDSVIEFDGRHFVVGAQDIYMFSGHPGSIQSIGDGRVRDYFYNDLNLVDLAQLFVLRYQQEDEIWICYPSQEAIQGRADKALIFNYRHNTWSKRDLPGVFNGVIGPVPGGGLPMASLGFEGEAQVSTTIPGVNHEITINGLVDLEMEGDGREYKETLDLSGIRLDAITGGDPSIRVTLLEDFYTGSDTPLRIVVRALNPVDETDILTEIYKILPSGLGNDPESGLFTPYDTVQYRNNVVNPIILELREDADDSITILNVVDEGFSNTSFDIIFNLDFIEGDNITPLVGIYTNVNTDHEYNLLSPEDRPQAGGTQDTTVDRIGHVIDKDTEDPDTYPNNSVFQFDFTDIWDRLDEFVFFFKGERTGFIDFNNRFSDLEDGISTIVAGILMTGETEDVSTGGTIDPDDPSASMDGGTFGGAVDDGHARVNSDFTDGVVLGVNVTGSQIKELIEMSLVPDNRRLDILVNKDDVAHFNLMAYMIPQDSDGNPDYYFNPVNTGILRLNFYTAEFNKDANSWVKGGALQPISAILSYSDSMAISQNALFSEAIANALNTGDVFTGVRTGETVAIQSAVNGAYILEWDIEDLIYENDNSPVPSTDIVSVNADFQQGIPAFRNTAGTLTAPCINIRYTDPDGIDFFSFDTDLIELRGLTNNTLTVEAQAELIDDRLQTVAPGQWSRSGTTWTTSAVLYNEPAGDTGVPYPGADGLYNFPSERNGNGWFIEYQNWDPSASYPTTSIMQQGQYEKITPGSFLALLMSDDVVYVFPVTGENIAMSLAPELESRLPQLNVVLTNSNQGLAIQPGVLGDNTIFMVEAYFNTTDTIDDFNRLTNPENYTQDPLNVMFSTSLPEAVLLPMVTEFPSVDDGPLIVNSVVTTEFDVDRTWSADQVDFSYEFPIFAGGEEFPVGSATNAVVAAEIGWSFPTFSVAGTTHVPYESFVERKQMALSPEFETEHLYSIALWADGSTPIQFQGEDRFNVFEFSASPTNNPGQTTDLSDPKIKNTFYISEDYKMDIRLNGRFLNWKVSDNITGPLECPGNKTFSQQTEWNLSGMQLSIRPSGSR